LQQNAAAAVAAFAAAAAAAAAAASQHQQQPAPGATSAVFTMAGSPVIMSPFQPRTRLKVASRGLLVGSIMFCFILYFFLVWGCM